MKALSIRQPWAWAIVTAGKPVENRTWRHSFRGPLLLHAGLARPGAGEIEDMVSIASAGDERAADIVHRAYHREVTDTRRFGGIVGIARVTGCVDTHPSPWFFGPHAFVLEDAAPLPFIACPGRLGVFDVGAEIRAQVLATEEYQAWERRLSKDGAA